MDFEAKIIRFIGEVIKSETDKIEVVILSYNNGNPILDIRKKWRKKDDTDGWKRGKRPSIGKKEIASKVVALLVEGEKYLREIDKMARPDFVQDEYLEYLDELKKSGNTNMLDARQHLMSEYLELTEKYARGICSYWRRIR